MPEAIPDDFAAFIALDWADKAHEGCMQDATTGKRSRFTLKQKPEALAKWVADLRERYENRPVAVTMEKCRGGLINFLMQHEFLVLYPVNPVTSAKFRKAFRTSGAKDDAGDAELLLDILLQHRDKLQAWKPDSVTTRKIAILTEKRRKAVDMRTAFCNQMRCLLKSYYPQALDLVSDDLYTPLTLEFLSRWPTLPAVKRAAAKTVRRFYKRQKSTRPALIEERIELIKNARPLTEDPAVVDSAVIELEMLLSQLKELSKAINTYDTELKKAYREHPDAEIFDSFPGAGDACAPRLLAAFGSDRDRFESAGDIQNLSGIAPVKSASGNTSVVKKRNACPKFLRQSFHEFAGASRKKSIWARAYYDMLRERGKKHHETIRSLAFKWIRILHRCWKNRVPYDEVRYLQQLQKQNAELLTYIPGGTTGD